MPNLFSAKCCLVSTASLLLFGQSAHAAPPVPSAPPLHTFSIIARDRDTGELGVAVQSRIVAVGAIVPFAAADAGAVATQALANVTFGPLALALLQEGNSAPKVLEQLQARDASMMHRQVAILPVSGAPAAYTGLECLPEAGHLTGADYSVQGNLLASKDVLPAMARAFQETPGLLEDRLLASLRAGQAQGGDRRGRQSAALLIVRTGWGYGGANDRFRDLRVDDHPEPIEELARILEVHRHLFPRPLKPQASPGLPPAPRPPGQ